MIEEQNIIISVQSLPAYFDHLGEKWQKMINCTHEYKTAEMNLKIAVKWQKNGTDDRNSF